MSAGPSCNVPMFGPEVSAGSRTDFKLGDIMKDEEIAKAFAAEFAKVKPQFPLEAKLEENMPSIPDECKPRKVLKPGEPNPDWKEGDPEPDWIKPKWPKEHEPIDFDALPQPMKFSPGLEKAIAEVCPSDDPLDQPDFDPIAHINKLFPNEESLSGIEEYQAKLKEELKTLDAEVLQGVRQQTSAGYQARKDLEAGKQSVRELMAKVRDIKTKAEASEQMVHEICRDIKSLDYAKKHLTQTITAMKRLQMLVTAADQLAVMTEERMYSEAANLLQAVNSLLVHFEGYTDIDKINELREKINTTRTRLRNQVFEDFNQLSALVSFSQPKTLTLISW